MGVSSVVVCAWLALVAAGARADGAARLFGAGAAHTYEALSAVLLSEAAPGGDVGFQLRATLQVSRHWPPADDAADDDPELLLRFHVSDVHVWGRGAGAHAEWASRGAPWGAGGDGAFYGTWRAGRVLAAHLQPDLDPHLLNYQRALLSLFQFQVPGAAGPDGEAAERNETDVSGACRVLYEPLSPHELRKIKSGCRWAEGAGDGEDEADGADDTVETRRVTRVTLTGARDAVASLHAEEVHAAGAALGVPLKARAYTTLRLVRTEPLAAPPAASLAAALPPALAPLALPLQRIAAEPDEQAEARLEEAWAAVRGAGAEGAPGAGGRASHAAALLRALPAVRAAAPAHLRALLRRDDALPLLPDLLRLLGLAGTRAAHQAAAELLQLRDDPPQPLADVYLAALALAPRPHEWTVLAALRLGAEARAERVAHAALLAAAAGAAPPAAEPLALSVRDALLKALANCKEEACEEALVRALGNMRRAGDSAELLRRAEGSAPAVALAALDALRDAPPHALGVGGVFRLLALAAPVAPAAPPAPLDVRAAALDLALVRAAAVRPPPTYLLVNAARTLHAHGPHELRRLLWQRVHSLPTLRALLPRLPADLRTWHAQSLNGTSSVLARETGWRAGGWAAGLDSVQAAEGGLLRRGWVRLALRGARGEELPALELQLWTRGLGALAGGAGDEDDAPAGGLALAVAGVRQRPLTLFSGQAELLGLVWAGAGSEPTAVLRAGVPLAERRAHVPLLTGAELEVRARGAAALALDAHAQVSLWSRTARARFAVRAAFATEARLLVRAPAPAAALRAAAHAHSEPRLTIAADLDFYDGVALCVRVALPEHEHSRNVSLVSRVGARGWRVSRGRAGAWRHAGRTLALGRPNDAACRALAHPDDDDE